MTESLVRSTVLEAGVWREGHVVLDSGRHSNTKLDMERLLERKNTMRQRLVINSLAAAMEGRNYDAMIPLPNGMLAITRAADIPRRLPRIIETRKQGERKFAINHPAAKQLLRKAEGLAIVDDVLTTGGRPLAMADTLRKLGCEAELDLYAIWRRDELSNDIGRVFVRQTYLVEETIPSWRAEECACQNQ